ncbi:glutamate [NMDA] receptor subunit 1 [Daphnia magna]|uniref:glutamate [NMDA] receptor subunit 1 n=1 Tax=Daphnia magna TaxID=35525 RepID=UPI001E1BCEAA|nr:glutamate [NMDA] receptor subunit 1 [Daphnia magna]
MKVAGMHKLKYFVSFQISLALLLVTGVDFSTENSLSPKHFNYLVYHNPPFDILTRGPNGTFSYFGASVYVVEWLAAKFNYTYTLIPVNQTIIDKYGTHEALFYQLINDKNIDGITGSFYLTMDRAERMDYTFHTWSDGFRLVVPRPGEESRLFAFIGPFEPMVWMLIFISIIVVVAMMTLFAMVYRHYPWNTCQVSDNKIMPEIDQGNGTRYSDSRNFLYNYVGSHMIYVVNIMTNQGSRESSSLYSFRILAGIWVLCAMVLVNSYTGIVISSLTTPKMKPSIELFEDLVASPDTKILLRHDTSIGEQILKATSGIYKVLGDQARSNPDEQIVGDAFTVSSKLETGRYAFPFVQTFSIAFVGSQYKKDKECRFKASKLLPISTGYYSWLFKKNSPFTKLYSRALMDYWESGLLNFGIKFLPTIPRAEKCFVSTTRRVARLLPIQLSDLTSAFLILGIGTGLAVLTFLLELLYSSINNPMRQYIEQQEKQ